MKKFIYILLLLTIFLVGCDNSNYDNNIIEVFDEIPTEENIEDIKTSTDEIENEIQFPKNAIVSGDTLLTTESGEVEIKHLSKVQLLNENENYYTVLYGDIQGRIIKENVMFFNLDTKSQYTLMLDVSQFNNDDKAYSFHSDYDLIKFVIKNKINYLYIRIGGRGYGQKGVLYKDDKTEFYTNICDYFGIPYGFYFIDEALNKNEAIEEVNFIKNIIAGKNFVMNKLPIAIDVEYGYGKSRADNSWNTRTPIINVLINEFKNNGYDCILYANGARIDTFIKNVNCNFWTAMYPRKNIIPGKFYVDIIKEEESKIKNNPDYLSDSFLSIDINMADTGKTEYTDEYLNKVKAWQFTENGATENGIEGYIDLSMVDNLYFYSFCK